MIRRATAPRGFLQVRGAAGVGLVLGALGLTACGSTAHPTSPPATTAQLNPVTTAHGSPATGTSAGAPNPSAPRADSALTRFLLTAGEEAGFAPRGGADSFSSLPGWVVYNGLTASDARLLRSEGFVAAAQETVGVDGASFVEEFTSAAGARREAATDARQALSATSSGATVTFFPVPGLTGAHGVLVTQAGGAGTNLYWTEGRCTMWLGNEASFILKPEVEAAAKAIDRRTGGQCP